MFSKILLSKRYSFQLLIGLFVGPILLQAERPPAQPPSDAEIAREYQKRATHVIDQGVAAVDPDDLSRGNLYEVAANLQRGTNLLWARERLRVLNEDPTGNMFWMIPMVLVMYAGEENLDDADWEFIRKMWRSYFPYRGDTENHWVMYYTALYLAAERFPDAGPESWYNGKSSADNMAEAKEFLLDWVRITTSYGQGEYNSPKYIEEYTRPMTLLASWAQDPQLRQVGHMMMDYILLEFALDNINGLYGGAHSRVYPRDFLQPSRTAAVSHAWLFFGQAEYSRNHSIQLIALSNYTPTPLLYRLVHERDEAYEHRQLKRTRWRLRNVGSEEFEVDGKRTKPVYRYSYVHPDYVLGSTQGGLLQPIQQRTWSLIWHEDDPQGVSNTMFGVQPYSSPHEGTMYFPEGWDTVTDLIARSKADYDTPDKLVGGSPHEHVVQHKSALIALYDIPEDNRFPLINTYFSRDLQNRTEDASGWIFAEGGPAYIAYYPLAGGEWKDPDWTGLMASGAGGWFSANFDEHSAGSECYVSYDLKNGYIVQVASAADHESFAAFKDEVRSLPLEASLEPVPKVRFTSLDGVEMAARYKEPLVVNGQTVYYEDWKLFEAPYAHSERESEMLEIRHGQERRLLDFKNYRIEHEILSK